MIVEKAYAKINIGLDIVGKRTDGYHNIDTIMQTIELHDTLSIEEVHSGICVSCSNPLIPIDGRNTAYKAAEVFFEKSGIDPTRVGVLIEIEKRIPCEAGLGGGSSDAAAVLCAMNKLFCTNYGTDTLLELALMVGSDVPFLMEGGTARAGGKGERLEKLVPFKGVHIVFVMPDETVSTAEAYSYFSSHGNPLHPDIGSIAANLDPKKPEKLAGLVGNTFECLILPVRPKIAQARHDILETAPLVCSMSGSGSAVYGLYDSSESAKRAYGILSDRYETYLTRTTGGVD